MTNRIDRDRDTLVVQDPDSLPGAIRDKHRGDKFTHAYPEGQAMNLGSTVLFGPKKAPPVQSVRVIERRPEGVAAEFSAAQEIEAGEVEPARSWAEEGEDDEEAVQQSWEAKR